MTAIVVHEQICHFASGPRQRDRPLHFATAIDPLSVAWLIWNFECGFISMTQWLPMTKFLPFAQVLLTPGGRPWYSYCHCSLICNPIDLKLCLRVHVSDVNVLHGRISRFRSSGPFWGWGPCTFGFILPLHSSDLKLLMRVHINDFISSKLTNFSILAKGHLQGVGPVALLDYCCSFIF